MLYENDKRHVANLIYEDFNIEVVRPKVNRENLAHICTTLIDCCEPKEYVLLIDDITTITPTSRRALEKLKDTFVIIAGARYINSFVWNFEQIRLKNLNRNYATQMIQSLSSGLEVENTEIFANHIYEQTDGNPRAIFELIDRYRKEPFLTNEGAIKEVDMTFIVVLFLAVMSAMRYMSRELDIPALRFIGALALVLLLVSRPFLMSLRKKKIKFTTENLICEKMRVKFFCNGIIGKTYVEGFIYKVLSKQKTIDSKGFEYNCEIFPDLILF